MGGQVFHRALVSALVDTETHNLNGVSQYFTLHPIVLPVSVLHEFEDLDLPLQLYHVLVCLLFSFRLICKCLLQLT